MGETRHRQIRITLQEMIEGPEYAPGERIPAERELAARFGASRMTVRRAIEDLIRLGMLERDSTNGTYVRHPPVIRPMGGPARGLTQMLRDIEGAPASRLESFEIEPAAGGIARRLAVAAGEPIVTLRRLRLIGGRPFALETSYLPRMVVPGLAAGDLENGSLYRVLEEQYGLQPTRADETIGVSRASPREAEALGLEPDAPVLLLRAVVFDQRDQPVEYLVSVNHPDRVVFGVSSPSVDLPGRGHERAT